MPNDSFQKIAKDMDNLPQQPENPNEAVKLILYGFFAAFLLFFLGSYLWNRAEQARTDWSNDQSSKLETEEWLADVDQETSFNWTIDDVQFLQGNDSMDVIVQTYGQPSRWDKDDLYAHLVWDSPASHLGDYPATVDLTFIADEQGDYRLQYGSFRNFPLPAGQSFSYNPDERSWKGLSEENFVTREQGEANRLHQILATYQPPTSLTLGQFLGEPRQIDYTYHSDDWSLSVHMTFIEESTGNWLLDFVHIEP